MPNYKKGKIYALICDETNLIYIGSTAVELNVRLQGHESKFRTYSNGSHRLLHIIRSFETKQLQNKID
jgi:hypothetical protein